MSVNSTIVIKPFLFKNVDNKRDDGIVGDVDDEADKKRLKYIRPTCQQCEGETRR